MICLLLNILKLHFLAVYELQVSIIDAAKHTAMNKIRYLACRSSHTRKGREDIFTAGAIEGCLC